MVCYVTGTPFLQEIIFNFQNCHNTITDTLAMKNALFCNPRFVFELTAEERRRAKVRLGALYNRLKSKFSSEIAPLW